MKFPKLALPLVDYRYQFYLPDLVISIFLMIEAGAIAYGGTQQIDPALLSEKTEDVWFGSDVARVIGDMTERGGNHARSKVHPLFSLLLYPIVTLLRVGVNGLTPFDLSKIDAVNLTLAIATALWAVLMYVTLRFIGCRRLDAAIFSVLMLSSAAAMFWAIIPESFLFGSLSMVMALTFAAIAQHRAFSPLWYVVISAITLSITTTNWLVGLVVTVVHQNWRRSLIISTSVLGLTSGLWLIQKRLFPTTEFFIGNFGEETHYILPHLSGGPLRVVSAFFFHTMVMPTIQVIPSNRNQPDWPMLSAQFALPGSGGLFGIVALVLWIALLGLGIWALLSSSHQAKLRWVIGLSLLSHLGLHLVYGEETFLYAIHIVPFLIVLCALATLTRFRFLVLGLAGTLAIAVTINNSIQFNQATQFLRNTGPLRQPVAAQVYPMPSAAPLALFRQTHAQS